MVFGLSFILYSFANKFIWKIFVDITFVSIITFLVKEMCSERVIYMDFIASCRAKNLVCVILKKGSGEAKKANGNQV